MDTMPALLRRTITHPTLAVGGTLLWGLVEFVALLRSRLTRRRAR